MANVTWSTTDKTASMTLSGSNLTATSAAIFQGVRASDKDTAAKFYWEITYTAVGGTMGAGLIPLSASLTSVPTVGAFLPTTGGLSIDGSQLATLGSITNGTLTCWALDAASKLIWVRRLAAGNWNNSGTANPATGTGGFSSPNIGGAVPGYPSFFTSANGAQVVANFGDTAFGGVVPAGFTSGFPAGGGVAAATTQASAMVLA